MEDSGEMVRVNFMKGNIQMAGFMIAKKKVEMGVNIDFCGAGRTYIEKVTVCGDQDG